MIKVGIIGCGGIARQHVTGYTDSGVEITAVTDYSSEAAAGLSKEIGGAKVYGDYRQLIDDAGVQAVSICTPPAAHEEAAIYALEHGVHVLCEKPMAYDIPSAHRIRAAAEASSALFMPAFRHRFLPAVVAFKKLVTSGRIGDVVLFNNIFCGPAFQMEGRWFTQKKIAGGGSLLDTNSHSVDLFRFMVGEITEQKAVMHRHFRTTDVEDAGILSVKAAGGAIGAMQSSFVAGSGMAFIDIIGSKGRAVYDYTDPERLRWRLTKDTDWSEEPVKLSGGFEEEIAHFLGAVRGEHPLSCTVEDGVRCMEVICSVYSSSPEYALA